MVFNTPTAELFIGPAILMAIVLSLIEIHFVHSDEIGLRWFSHAIHTVPFMFLFTFIAMNITWALSFAGLGSNFFVDLGARAIVGIVAMIKIKAAASLTGNGGVGESNIHVLIIGILIMASAYIWDFGLAPLIGGYIPF